jgi:myogenesis-regulating glycosidase
LKRQKLCLLLAVSAACTVAQVTPFEFKESAQEVAIETARYRLAITREGFNLRLFRAGHLVLESAQPGDPASNLDFQRNETAHHITSLKSAVRSGSKIALEYATTYTESSAYVEIEPRAEAIRVSVWLLHADGDLAPNFRLRLAPSGLWYGGGFQGWRDPQVFPLNKARIVKEAFLAQGNTQGTPAWYTTKGVGIWVRTPHDFRYSFNKLRNGAEDGLFSVEMPAASALTYDILVGQDIRDVVRRIVREIGFPRSVPPSDYFRLPIYTTWVEHKVDVSQAKVLEYARNIHSHDLPCGVIEIDDKWESLYGDMEFDSTKFPDPKAMVDELHRLGYRVTLWVHPFVNLDAKTFAQPRFHALLLKDPRGEPGLIRWWNGIAAVWDFTNSAASAEFRARLERLQSRYGLDGFKFDGGDVNLLPRDLRASKPITAAEYPDIYNREATARFPWEETRVGVYSQPLGIVQRLIDKHSVWGRENGLAAIVPEAITVSLRGFPYVMPDMIGGNQYDNDRIDKELLVRWAQASALMPLVQFSWAPWHFDEEAVRLCRDASRLHSKFAGYIIKLAQDATRTGEPILRPVWYTEPADPEAAAITDQFMIGEDLMVAPVLEKGAVSRRLYLPAGRWVDLKGGRTLDGARWLQYAAPLDTLPVFVREGAALSEPGTRAKP